MHRHEGVWYLLLALIRTNFKTLRYTLTKGKVCPALFWVCLTLGKVCLTVNYSPRFGGQVHRHEGVWYLLLALVGQAYEGDKKDTHVRLTQKTK